MKRLMLSSALILGCLPVASYATTLNLTFDAVGGQSNGSFYIYPYYFSFDGSPTLTPLMCASFDNEISVGESWKATEQVINTHSSLVDQEMAYLYQQLGTAYSNNDVQEAVWFLSASNPGSVPLTADDPALLLAASGAVTAADLGGPQTFDSGEVAFLVPIAGSQTPGHGLPQTFLVDPKVAGITPEPSSLILTGTGFLGSVVTALRRRRARA